MRLGTISNATQDMMHPQGFAFFMTLMFCFFLGFVFYIFAISYFSGREAAVFTSGLLVGGLIFSWLLGAFDTPVGNAEASGFLVASVSWSWVLLRKGRLND